MPTGSEAEKQARYFFLLALLAGFTLAALRAKFEFNYWYIVIVSVAIFFFYGRLVKKLAPDYYPTPEFADGLYLMGFLFTLMSLAIGLAPWGGGSPEKIIGQNAIALWTTIIGLAARIYIRQFNHEAKGDQVHTAIEDLAQYVEEISRIARRLESSFLRLASATDDAKSSLSSSAAQIKDVNVPRYVLSDKLASVEVPTAAFADLIRRLEAPMDTLSDRMKRSFSTVEEELAGLASALANLRRHLGVVEETADGAERKDAVRVPPTGLGPAASFVSLFRRDSGS